MTIFHPLRAGLAIALAGVALGASPARSETFSIPNGDVAALKAALRSAGSNGQADTISLAANGAYVLSGPDNVLSGPNGLPVVEADGGSALTIQGNGATIARSGASGTPAFRLAFVRRGAVVSLSRLTLRNGSTTDWGGCINNEGRLSLANCSLLSSAAANAGALVNFGTASLSACVVSGNRARFGGGITNYISLSLSGCSMSGNSAVESGGAIDNAYRARLNAQNSAFFNNRARNAGALQNFGSAAVLFQCTFSGNAAIDRGGAIANIGGLGDNLPISASVSLRACTITANRAQVAGGIDSLRGPARATVALRSSIVAGNTASFSPDLANNDVVQNGGFNLIGGNPGLAPLANNGGLTPTHALLPGSRALNTGDLAPGTPFDQRGAGFARVRGNRADIGAFESQQAPGPSPTPAPTATPGPTATPAPTPTLGPGQVRSASNGHVYEIVSARLTWDEARAAAQARTFAGVRGHLATITSAAEQDVIAGLRRQAGEVEG